jgi:hypothetical protein
MPQRKNKTVEGGKDGPQRVKLAKPIYLENGKYACPKCISREHLEIIDYDCAEEGQFLFIIRCNKCRIKFAVKKRV